MVLPIRGTGLGSTTHNRIHIATRMICYFTKKWKLQ